MTMPPNGTEIADDIGQKERLEVKIQQVEEVEGNGDLIITAVAVDKQKTPNRKGFQFDWDKPSDVVVANWKKNPVFLFWHRHRSYPLGMIQSIEIDNTKVVITARIPDMSNEPGFEELDEYVYAPVRTLIRKGMLRAVSIGFIPLEAVRVEDGGRTWVRIKRFEIVECSIVTIPAHESAVVTGVEDGEEQAVEQVEQAADMVRAFFDDHETFEAPLSPGPGKERNEEGVVCMSWDWVRDNPENDNEADPTPALPLDASKVHLDGLEAALEDAGYKLVVEDGIGNIVALEWKGVPYSRHGDVKKAARDKEWDGPAQVKAADVEDLRVMAAIEDTDNRDVKKGYKLPHHEADGHAVVWRGVAAAMAAILGARGGVDAPTAAKRAAYRHLSKHYKQFDEDPPAFKEQGYETEELNALHEAGRIIVPGQPLPESEQSGPDLTPLADVTDQLEAFEARVARLEDALGMNPPESDAEDFEQAAEGEPGESPARRGPLAIEIGGDAIRAIVQGQIEAHSRAEK
jgi:HK97 family phage prohead protease